MYRRENSNYAYSPESHTPKNFLSSLFVSFCFVFLSILDGDDDGIPPIAIGSGIPVTAGSVKTAAPTSPSRGAVKSSRLRTLFIGEVKTKMAKQVELTQGLQDSFFLLRQNRDDLIAA